MATESAHVTVATTATLIRRAYGAEDLAVRNLDASLAIAVGGADVTVATGYPLAAGEGLGMTLGGGEALYGVVASGTATVAWLRVPR